MSAAKKEESYVISVSVGTGCYRHIMISSKSTLFDLHAAIIDAFEFMDDHAHVFFMNNKEWDDSDSYYSDQMEDEDRYTTDYKLEDVGLFAGKQFKYIFDFGDEWLFKCKVLKVLDEKTLIPEIVRTKGDAPLQYECADDDFEENENE